MAAALAGSGHVVAVVDRDADVCGQVERLGIDAIHGDACTMDCLEAAEVRQRDVLVAVTGVDENNLIAAFLAKREYGVPRIIARVNDPANAWLYTPDCGVDVAVSQAHLLSTIVQEELSLGAMVTLASLRGGKVAVVEERLPPGSGLIVIAERRTTLRVRGVVASLNARSQAAATSVLKRQVSGAPGSEPPRRPVVSSLGAS